MIMRNVYIIRTTGTMRLAATELVRHLHGSACCWSCGLPWHAACCMLHVVPLMFYTANLVHVLALQGTVAEENG